MAENGNALMIDCEQPLKKDCAQQVPLSDPSLVVLVADTSVRHKLAGGEYNKRRASCESAVSQLKVKSLRYASMEKLEEGYYFEGEGPQNKKGKVANQLLGGAVINRLVKIISGSC